MTPGPISAAASEAWALLFGPPIAHRGLWAQRGAPENSLPAFEAACDAGYGVELDVRLSADGEVMVFHDAGLERMCGTQGRLADRTAAELKALRLEGGRQIIPTLRQVFDIVASRALILVELKTREGEEGPLERAVAAVLDAYHGPVAIIGFNPRSHRWWAKHWPDVLRGLNSYAYDDDAARRLPDEERLARRNLDHIAAATPHFLVLSTDILEGEAATRARAAGFPIVAWTVRSQAQWGALHAQADNLIFEGFSPEP